jgi:hypothetical protein
MAAIFLAGQMAGVGVLALPAALIVNIFSHNLYITFGLKLTLLA